MNEKSLKRSLIPIVTIGSILEWYEIGLYIYWASLIEGIMLDIGNPLSELINIILVICTGFLARPLGGFIFGRLGDKQGRKKAFALSVIFVAIPTFLIGITQSYEEWSLFSVIFLGLMKFIQGIPAGGEIPGAICYLSENAPPRKKYYTLSFAFIGPQIGLLLSLTQCLLLQKYIPEHFLTQGMWRISFLLCGFLGFLAYLLRNTLEETEKYTKVKEHNEVERCPTKDLFKSHKKQLFLGGCVSIFQITAFSLITIVPIFHFKKNFDLNDNQNLVVCISALILCSIIPLFIGKLADKYKSVPFLWISAIGFIVFSYPFYLSIKENLLIPTLMTRFFLIVFYSIQTALLPAILADLFPTRIRYTGIGFSFNICDGLFLGLIPTLSFLLIQKTQEIASFVWFFPIIPIIFLISYHFTKKEIKKNTLN